MSQQTSSRDIDAVVLGNLRAQAAAVAHHAYAPYSNFHVGAALLLDGGETVSGCNVENASYRLTTCAEQTAVVRAVAEHGPGVRIVAVAVANADPAVACQPCGACRQTLAEFADSTCRIFYPGDGGKPGECTLADLLPASFTSASLRCLHFMERFKAMSDVKTIHPIDVILHKRDGQELSDAEIRSFIAGVVSGDVSDARVASLLMAIFQRGLSALELATLTDAMRRSGEVFDSRFLKKFTVDKHSTGGVGDKSSLLIAPIVAAAGLADPMISGRSLGHTGGTLDKLETIPGFDTQLSLQRFGEVIAACGFSMIGQTKNLVPADRILYALRDHTGTVESPYLITASIMSKKLAEDLDGLVLDVKTGSGAFMRRYEDSQHLARLMVSTGEGNGTRTVALLTSMDEPLGRFSGNWIEVWECIEIMRGISHPMYADLIELSVVLAGWMLHLGGIADSPEAGKAKSLDLLQSGAAYDRWLQMVKLHGGDASPFDDPAAFHKPAATRVLRAERDGYLEGMDCTEVGWAVQRLGAGREVPGGPVAAHAGIEMHAKIGDRVHAGQPLVTLFTEDPALLDTPERMLRDTLRIGAEAPQRMPLVREIVTAL